MSSALDVVEENIFKVKSENFKNNDTLPINQVYTQANGKNLSPELNWQNAPQETKSFAIVCHDPDAPKENGWYHWILINIPKEVNSIKENGHIKEAKELITDFETPGYNGACPPKGHGIHHYNFTVYALDTDKLEIKENENPVLSHRKILEHTIVKSTITALYER